jgi:excisionase family DNA binding protein
MNTQLLKGPEVAKMLNVSRAAVYRLITQGQLPAVRFNKTLRVKPEDLDAFIKANSIGGVNVSSGLNSWNSNKL